MDSTYKIGKVYLIGAGPGDPKLLTIRAAEALAASDVIVYDYLVNPEVLIHSRRGATLIFAGKRAGERSIPQSEINRILIDNARCGHVVARLKGGDPFIFGRGGEEAEALVDAGIEWEVIPGVSSGLAAAAYAGIPLTHRDHSSSVAFITGHDGQEGRDGQEGHDGRAKTRNGVDWSRAALAADTLVVFMCASTIGRIAQDLIAAGRSGLTPIAIIRWGTYECQEVYTGTLDGLASVESQPALGAQASSLLNDEEPSGEGLSIRPPAIAIIGEVVSLREKLKWFSPELEHRLAVDSDVVETELVKA
jgi:uroporphyrin-III C-methyltransferase